jgi:hypothetical protein
MIVLVVYDSDLLQIRNELEEFLLQVRLVHLQFALDQSLEGGRLDFRHKILDSFLRLAINEIQSQISVQRIVVSNCRRDM